MSQNGLALDGWLDLAISGTDETVQMCLMGKDFAVVDRRLGAPKFSAGTMLPLVTHAMTMYVCLFTTEEGCEALAKGLLGMEEDDEDEISHEEIRDAVGEIVNILAGVMQTKLGDIYPGIELALPCFLNGKVVHEPTENAAVAEVKIGELNAELLVFGNSKAA